MQQNPFNRPTNQPDSYKTLIVFRKSECVYDITFYFVSRFLERSHDRTVDQMQQAARSGKQNIVEGYSDAEGSTEIEHKLTVIAKGSLEELKEDYKDYLRATMVWRYGDLSIPNTGWHSHCADASTTAHGIEGR